MSIENDIDSNPAYENNMQFKNICLYVMFIFMLIYFH